MTTDQQIALSELGAALEAIDPTQLEAACAMIARANHLMLYGCGREGLQMQGFAMRLWHLGLKAGMAGAMNAPPLGAGDVLIVSAGPGELSTVRALMEVARRDGAQVLFVTGTPDSPSAKMADHVLYVPAQTMANDQGPGARSVLPMGSVYEGALFVLFEMMVLDLRTRLNVSPDAMRARHTNME